MAKGTLNKVMLIGRLGADPELKYLPSGSAVINFTLATVETWKDQSGQQQEKTEWHRIVAWKKLADIIGQSCKKGSRIYIEGRNETRSYEDQSGNKRYITEVVVNTVEFLDSKPSIGESKPEPAQPELNNSDVPPENDGLPF